MPRYFCDYCDAYLTRDSAPGRAQHLRGWRHRENFKNYYMQYFGAWNAQQMAANGGAFMQFPPQMGMGQMMPPPMMAMPINAMPQQQQQQQQQQQATQSNE
jgi:hypothetical protein